MSASIMNRFSMLVRPCKWKTGKLYGQLPENSFADLDLVRAGTKYVMNSAGVLVLRAANEPAFGYRYDGANVVQNGLRIERAATNLILRSEEFTNAAWNKVRTTITANTHTAPDNNLTADTLTVNATGACRLNQVRTGLTAGQEFVFSVYVKAGNVSEFSLDGLDSGESISSSARFNLATNAITIIGSNYVQSGTIEDAPNGFKRCVARMIIPVGQTTLNANIQAFPAVLNNNIIIWGAQLETGRVATTYKATTTGSVTGVADAYSKTGLSSILNNTTREGTIYLVLRRDLQSAAAELLSLTQAAGSTTNRLLLATTADDRIRAVVTNGGVDQADIQSAATQSGTIHVAFAYKDNDCQLYLNGASVGTDTGVTIPSNLAELFLGGVNVTNNAHYWMRLYGYCPERLTTAQIASLYTNLQSAA